MGCASSKSPVQAIEIKDGKVSKTNKKIKVLSSDETLVNENNAIVISEKSKSAKSRDSGIEEMDFERSYSNDENIITEESDPHLIQDIENESRPKTPELSLVGRQFQSKSAGRARSTAILKELEAEGLISGPKIERGGSAFEVRLGPLQPLEPLAPVRRPPPRLERLKSAKKLVTKDELEEKMKQAEERRKETLQRRSRLASQLARDQSLASKLNSGSDDEAFEDSNQVTSKPPIPKRDEKEDNVFKSTVFDATSMDSFDAASPGLTDSTDAFYKDISPSVDGAFS